MIPELFELYDAHNIHDMHNHDEVDALALMLGTDNIKNARNTFRCWVLFTDWEISVLKITPLDQWQLSGWRPKTTAT